MLLAIYSWYMLHNMNQHTYVPVSPVPNTLNVTTEPKVEHNETSLEGLVTWTSARVIRRLKRANAAGNIGQGMRFSKSQKWLESCLCHLPKATVRDKVLTSLTGEHELSDGDDSPSGQASTMRDDEKAFHTEGYAQTHRCIIKLFELNRMETALDLLHSFNEACQYLDPQHGSQAATLP